MNGFGRHLVKREPLDGFKRPGTTARRGRLGEAELLEVEGEDRELGGGEASCNERGFMMSPLLTVSQDFLSIFPSRRGE